jgi:tetratricopeptide (TPR) repeat protein
MSSNDCKPTGAKPIKPFPRPSASWRKWIPSMIKDGRCFAYLHNHTMAIVFFLEALDILEKQVSVNKDYLSMVHLNLANIYDEMGERELSEEHYSFAS